MKFDMKNIHTIFESAKSKNCVPSEHADKEGAKIDATLGSSDLNELFDNICPICGDVFASMKSAAADPKNLKITMTKTQDLGESAHIYIEAVEFATFCEAAELEINEAADAIKATCEEMVPGSQDSELHVVFPSECLNNGNLGSNRFGLDVNNDWAMQLMRGCRRYGISVNSGVEDGEHVTESAYKKAMNESTNTYNGYPYSGKTFRKIPIEYYSRDERVEITKEQKAKFNADFAVVKSVYDEIFESKFIPWLLGPLKSEDEKKDAVKSLELYNITYFQRRNDIGEFEFQYLVKNPGDKAKEPVAFCVSVKDGKIIKTSGYDI